MRFETHVLSVLVLCAALSAQTFTSPRGYDAVEGNGSHPHILASVEALRWQQIDTTLRGSGISNIRSIAWRRDGNLATSAAYATRVLEQMTVVLAHSRLGAIAKDFAANYSDQPVTVFTPKNVNAPDWSQRPATAPAPFDFKLTFDQQWSYNGSDDFLWEVRINKVTPAQTTLRNYPFDFQPGTGTFAVPNEGVALGQGCIAKGQTTRRFFLSTSIFDHGTRFQLRHSVNFAPRDSTIVTFLDARDANLSVGGLCAVLRALPTIVIPLGLASAGGSVPAGFIDRIPYDASWIGQNLFLQAAGLDDSQAGIQVALSQGDRLTVPATPSLPGVGRVHGYTVQGARALYGPWAGGVIAQFEY